MTYFLILGKNNKLSAAEITVCFDAQGKLTLSATNVLLLETNKSFDAVSAMKRLGGTIKIGEIIGKIKNFRELPGLIMAHPKFFTEKLGRANKFYFGISNYAGFKGQDVKRLAMEIKKEMKKSGPVRWVVSKEKILSSVVVKTNKLLENGAEICLFRDGFIGKTLAVQEFEEFEKRDFGKPQRNILRGMLPPKLAKIMINLACAKKDECILDPFCGTGTVLMEAVTLGYKNLIGSDLDAKAIEETKENLEWLAKKTDSKLNYKIFVSPAEKISEKISEHSVGAIVTEPYLGPLLRGNEPEGKIKQTILELENLYLKSFFDWKKILKKGTKVVMIFPVFNIKGKKINLQIKEEIEQLGFKKIKLKSVGGLVIDELVYERPDQKVLRGIEIFEN